MREILFRGKRLEIGDFVEGSLITYPDGDCYIACPSGDPNVLDKFCADPATVGQYTGLKDKYNKRIFEHDILCVEDNVWVVDHWGKKQFICEIVFKDNDARFTGVGKARPREWLYRWNANSYEVIGNIHDNPKLLEGGADV